MVGAARGSSVAAALGRLGYEDCGQFPGRRYLSLRQHEDVNVQVVEHGGELWFANLRFRDHLRGNPEAAGRYAAAKGRAAARAGTLLAYSEATRPALEALLVEALAAARDGGSHASAGAPPVVRRSI